MLKAIQTIKRTVALLGVTAAAAASAAALGAAPASAATFSSSAKPAAALAASTAFAVHPNVVTLGDCGEDYTVTGTVVNVRSRWGTSSPIISEAYKGDEFIADWRTSYTYNGYYWAYGYDLTRNGPVGYIAMAYLHDTGQVAGCTVLS